MAQIIAYLSFPGNCREAMSFYKECFGGELRMQTVGESAMADKMPAETKNDIMHSLLTSNGLTLMASDMMREKPVNGNTVSLLVNCSSEKEIQDLFAIFSSGGQITDPLSETFWGATFGSLKDKFGINWMFDYEKPKP